MSFPKKCCDWFNGNCTEDKECLTLMISNFNVKNELESKGNMSQDNTDVLNKLGL